jgi:predicted Zn-dependent protease
MDDREKRLRQLAAEFPDSAMGHFSLGGYLVEVGRFAEAVESLERATRAQPDYAAAWVALGDARVSSGSAAEARVAYAEARKHAVAQGHQGLAEEIDLKAKAVG